MAIVAVNIEFTVLRIDMIRVGMFRLLLIVAACCCPAVAAAQSGETVLYYHADAIGSARMITNETQQVMARYDYLPFGEEWNPASFRDPRLFAGKERDAESGFDYFGARYYQNQAGRFTSPDPITVNALRLVNPQRWNRYIYAVNNSLKFIDPDGLDALLINYTDGAHGLGHMGIMALSLDGAGLYGGFNPVHPGRPLDRGTVKSVTFPAGFVQFGLDGHPTDASLARLRQRLAAADGKSADAIRIRHIKTSSAETTALQDYIRQAIKSPSPYIVGANDCLDFCVGGLWSAGVLAPPPSTVLGGAIPDLYFRSFLLDLAGRLAGWGQPRTRVETSYCFQGLDCR